MGGRYFFAMTYADAPHPEGGLLARRDARSRKRGSDVLHVPLDDALGIPVPEQFDLIALDGALDQLAAFDARKCQVVEMRFFAGLAAKDIAVVLKTTEATVRRDWVIWPKHGFSATWKGHATGMSAGGRQSEMEEVELASGGVSRTAEEKRAALSRQRRRVTGAQNLESLLAAHGRAGGFSAGKRPPRTVRQRRETAHRL